MIRELAAGPSDAVWECSSGHEAVYVARYFRPDCATIDIRMPGLDGFETVRLLRSEHASLRVVIVTSFEDSEFRRLAIEVGVAGYVTKENLSEIRLVLTGADGGSAQARFR